MNNQENPAVPEPVAEISARYLTYNIFVFLITILALSSMLAYYFLPLPPEVKQVLYISDFFACILLMFDFFRMVRIGRRIRRTASAEVLQQARQRLGESTLMVGILLVYLVVMLGSIGVVLVETPDPQANIRSGWDAIWWSFVTIATVGYGDRYPVTVGGRMIGILMMVIGVGVFSILTGFLALSFQNRRAKQQEEALDRLREELRQLRMLLEKGRELRSQRPGSPEDIHDPSQIEPHE